MRCLSVPGTVHSCLLLVCILAQRSVGQDLFDCEAGLPNSKAWSEAKKDWCCKNKNKGCEETDIAPDAPAASDKDVGDDAVAATEQAAHSADAAESATGSKASVSAASVDVGTAPAPPPKPPVPPVQPADPVKPTPAKQPAKPQKPANPEAKPEPAKPVAAAPAKPAAPSAPVRVLAAETSTTKTTTISEAKLKSQAAQAAVAAQSSLDKQLHKAAVEERDIAKVRSLIAQRADINCWAGSEGNVLYNLGKQKTADSSVKNHVAALVALNADLDMVDSRGRTPLFNAAVHGKNMHLVEAFKDSKNPNPHRGYGVTALQLAVRDGREDIVKALLDMRADPERGAKSECKEHKLPNTMRALLGMPPEVTSAARRLMDGDL